MASLTRAARSFENAASLSARRPCWGRRVRDLFWWCIAIGVVAAGFGWAAATAGAATTSVSINFDDVSAPCTFHQTVALTTQYSSQGVKFSGPGAHNGGGVLNACGNFGVSG